MAMNQNRKLQHLAPTNDQNISCPDHCVIDSTCTSDCYAYADSFPIPPPQLPPAPASSSGGGQPMPTVLIIIITVLGTGFLLFSYYVIMVKFCKRWNPFRPRRRQPPAALNEEFLDENRGPEIDHPIWYINTIGLQPSIINAITVFRYKRGDNLIEGTECAVCLNEFQNDETLRLLPKCNHAFHIRCIDTWLRSHTNCPVCRAGIVSSALANPVASSGFNSIIPPGDDASERENSETGELNNSDEVRDDGLRENRPDANDATQFSGVDNDQNEATDKSTADSKENNDAFMIEDEKHEIQSVRRSVSVDSFMAADISRAVDGLSRGEGEEVLVSPNEVKVQLGSEDDRGGNSGRQRIDCGSSITEFLRKKPVRMKRSFSYAGRSFLPRHHPGSNSTLPL